MTTWRALGLDYDELNDALADIADRTAEWLNMVDDGDITEHGALDNVRYELERLARQIKVRMRQLKG